MNLQVRNALIGFGITFGLSLVLGIAGAGKVAFLPSLVLGMGTWFVLSMLANNRNVKSLTDAERDAMLAAMPAPGTGFVFIYREGFVGRALGVDVVMDGSLVAQLKSPRCTRLVLKAGEHALAAGPKGFAGTQNKAASTSFLLQDGETIVFALALKTGMVQNSVTLQREPDARLALNKLRLITMVESDQSGVNFGGADPLSSPQ